MTLIPQAVVSVAFAHLRGSSPALPTEKAVPTPPGGSWPSFATSRLPAATYKEAWIETEEGGLG